jgi:hypothetical protein
LIVVSGVLVVVALVFLVIGLFGSGTGMIWASIITSAVAAVFLLLGALQRRGAPAAATDAGPAPDAAEHVTAVNVRPREEAPAMAAAVAEVSVVPGRPRYHVESCRFLTGRPDVETVPVDQAKAEGYTACGVCKPDAALAAAAASEPAVDASGPAADDEVETLLETPAARKSAAKAPAKTAAKKAAAASGTTTRATATASPAKSAAKAAPAKAAPAKAAPAKAAAKKAPAAAAQVVVIPDRDKFHVGTCRFVQGVPGTLTIAKASARRQGYTPCGVCKP